MKTQCIIVLAITMMAQVTFCGVICSCDSASVAIDSRVGVEPVLDSIVIPWDASWIGGDAGATVVITDNGVEVKRATGIGEFLLSGIGKHELTYTTYIGGVAQEEIYTATVYAQWKYEVRDGVAMIVGTTQTSGAVTIPFEIDGYVVTSIGSRAFEGCSGLVNITIPDSVTSVGNSAFSGCSGLTSITIPNSVMSIGAGALSGCGGLKSMTLPFVGSCRGNSGDVDSVFGYIFGSSSFTGGTKVTQCYDGPENSPKVDYYVPTSLRSVVITDETKLGYGAFYGLNWLTNISLNIGVGNIGGYAFRNCTGLTEFDLPSSVSAIEVGAFRGCSGLGNLTIPHGVSSIAAYAFSECSGLTRVVLPDSVKSIESSAFNGCSGLDSMTIPDSVTSIGAAAFSGCSGLTSLTIPDSVTSIGTGALSKCSGLTNITIPFIGSKRGNSGTTDSLFGYIFGTSSYAGGTAVKQYYSSSSSSTFYIPCSLRLVTVTDESVLGHGAFYGCSGLTGITIPDSVTHIGNNAFNGCGGLHDVVIPESLVDIGDRAFVGCRGLTSVTIPDSVTRIGERAFAECANLESMTLPFIGSGRGVNTGIGSVFGYVFGAVSFQGGTNVVFTYLTGSGTATATLSCWLPESLKDVVITDEAIVARGAFEQCVCLTNVVINDGVTAIGENAFFGCSGLTSLTIPVLYDLGDNDLRSVGTQSEGQNGLWIQGGWLLGYVGEAPAEVTVPEGVEGIASYAFERQTGLECVVLPSSLKYIGVNAFRGCTALEEVEIPDAVVKIDVGAFKNCTWLQDLKLPQDLQIIGMEAFANCAMLPNIVCADGLATVGEQAFSNCWRMLSVSLPVSVTNIGRTAFVDCKRLTGVHAPTHLLPFCDLFPAAYSNITTVVVPDGETRLVDKAFMGCWALVDVSLPESVTQMGNCVFSNCTAMVDVSLPDGIVKIGNSAFQGCIALEDVKLPRSLTEIGDAAFRQCAALEHIALPYTIERIGNYAFCDDERLEEINLPVSLKHVGAYAFYNCAKTTAASYASGLKYLGEKAYGNCVAVRDVYIPSSVTSLGSAIFYNCSAITNITTATAHRTMADMFPSVYNKLTKIIIAPGETKVCNSCFANCVKLTEIGLPDTVTTMGNNAFSGCAALASASLSQRLQGLPDYAFRNCRALATLTVPESVATLGKNVFDGCASLESIYFVGNAPQYDEAVFSGIADGVTVFVVNGSLGWDGVPTSRALPDGWPTSNTREITYWEPNRFNVVFDANGGLPATNILEEITGMTYALPVQEPTMAGATFLGWWTERVNGAQVTAGTQVTLTRAHTFYAHWAGNLYHVAFDANGGMGEMADRTCVVGEATELPLNVFARPGFAFAGWALEPDGETVYADGSSVVDLTLESDATVVLYAVWNEQAWVAGDYMNAPGRLFVMGDGEAWTNDVSVSHDGIGSMRSGTIGIESESSMYTAVVGEGEVSFWWKVSCEETYKGDRYDYVYFAVDGVERAWIAGEVDWTNVTFRVTGTGQHTLTWCYHKDDWDEPYYDGEDCAWVDEFVWVPAAVTATFDGNGNTAGKAPVDVVKYEGYSLTMPGAGTLERFSYVFGGWSDGSNTYAPGSIYVFTGADVAFSAVWIEKVWTYADFLNCENLLFTTAVGAEWRGDFATNHDWQASARSAAIGDG